MPRHKPMHAFDSRFYLGPGCPRRPFCSLNANAMTLRDWLRLWFQFDAKRKLRIHTHKNHAEVILTLEKGSVGFALLTSLTAILAKTVMKLYINVLQADCLKPTPKCFRWLSFSFVLSVSCMVASKWRNNFFCNNHNICLSFTSALVSRIRKTGMSAT